MTRALVVLAYLSLVPRASGKRVKLNDDASLADSSNDTDDSHAAIGPGSAGEALWPELVPPPGQTWTFLSRESVRWVETNEYQWYVEIERSSQIANVQEAGMAPFAMLQGKWTSNSFGHQTVHVRDMSGQERFMIRNSKNVWNPFAMRSSFRLHPPGNKEGILYTFNKDVLGRGFMGIKEEWRIYYGRERQGQQVYYCVGSYFGWTYNCYKSQSDYDMGAQPIAYTEQEMNAGAIFKDFSLWLPDNYRLLIREGVDSALILALMTVIDICNDAKHQAQSALETGANSTSNRSELRSVEPHNFEQ